MQECIIHIQAKYPLMKRFQMGYNKAESTNMEHPELKYLNFADLRTKLAGRGRSSIYRDVEQGRLPKPVKIGARLYWSEADIDDAISSLAGK